MKLANNLIAHLPFEYKQDEKLHFTSVLVSVRVINTNRARPFSVLIQWERFCVNSMGEHNVFRAQRF